MAFAAFLGFLFCLLQLSTAVNYTESIEQCERVVDVAIVGAGTAGTYAAYRLRNSNLTIELIEYSNRTGGRIFTSSLPNAPDTPLELGIMKYTKDMDSRVERLVQELGLETKKVSDDSDKKIAIRGQMYTLEEIKKSKDVPFDLTQEERDNQDNLPLHYLKKLTDTNETMVTDRNVMKLKLRDGRSLHKVGVHEALSMVASSEGFEFLKAIAMHDGPFDKNASAADLFHYFLCKNESEQTKYTLKDGMSALPDGLVWRFLVASTKHKLRINRKVESIVKTEEQKDVYILRLRETEQNEFEVVEKKNIERVCAKKVILAIPQRALVELDWDKLRNEKVWEALNAVRPVKTGTVYLTFSKAWWQTDSPRSMNSSVESDASIGAMVNQKSQNSSGDCVMLASTTDMYKAEFLDNLNCEGKMINGSDPGANRVNSGLKQEILIHLAEIMDVPRKNISEPTGGISQFYSKYPFGGGYTIWKKGYNQEEVRQTIQHPSLTDEVYIVGSDHALSSNTMSIEAALQSVEEVCEKYQI